MGLSDNYLPKTAVLTNNLIASCRKFNAKNIIYIIIKYLHKLYKIFYKKNNKI